MKGGTKMAVNRKLGRDSAARRALLRNQVTNLLYHGKIETTDAKAREVKKIAERLIAIAVKEKDNFEEVKVVAKVPKKDKEGKRIKEVVNGKKVTVYDEIEKVIKKDMPSRLNARRQIMAFIMPVKEVGDLSKQRSTTTSVNMMNKLFEEIAPKYTERKGGYTRIIKIGQRRGDAAEMVVIELV